MRRSRPDNRRKPQRDDSEFMALEFDSTLGYPGEGPSRVPDFGIDGKMQFLRPRSMESTTWRKCRKF